MRAHELNNDGMIINTIIVESEDFKSGLVNADDVGGEIGDFVIGGVLVKATVTRDQSDYLENKAEYMDLVREQRDKVLSRLNGISATMYLREPPALVDEKACCLTLIQALLDITILPSVVAATTQLQLKQAVKMEYARLVNLANATSPDLVKAFRQVDA